MDECRSTEPSASKDEAPTKRLRVERSSESKYVLTQGRSVVQVFATIAVETYAYPYSQPSQEHTQSTAFVLRVRKEPGESRLVLCTNNHAVQHSSYVQVKRRDQDRKYDAAVLVAGYECDLALLAVEETDFWEGLEPMELATDMPHLLTPVTVLGFPHGGDNLCTTQGVVSRLDVLSYGSSHVELLVIQIDAAINSGSSGGPAFCGEMVVGVAFSGLLGAQNIGYVVPSRVLIRFLRDFESRGRHTHFCFVPFRWQTLDTKDLRRFFGVEECRCGVRVSQVHDSIKSALAVDDVVLEIDGHSIGHDGKVSLGQGYETRVSLWLALCEKLTGETCTVQVRRGGQELKVDFVLQAYKPVVPADPYYVGRLDYFIVAGLVFQPVTALYLEQIGKASKLVLKGLHGVWAKEGNQGQGPIVLGNVLQHPVNVGVIYYSILTKFNGQVLESLKDLAAAVDACEEPWMRFEFKRREICVMESQRAREATVRVLEQFGIASDRRLKA